MYPTGRQYLAHMVQMCAGIAAAPPRIDETRPKRLALRGASVLPDSSAAVHCGDGLAAARAGGLSSVPADFEHALYDEARRAGLQMLVTHVHESDRAARAWAEGAGWRPYGTITRYQLGWPPLLARSVYVHRDDTPRRAAAAAPAEELARMRLPRNWSEGTPSTAAGS